MSKSEKAFSASTMSAEGAEEMSSRGHLYTANGHYSTSVNPYIANRLGTLVYGSSVGSAKRKTQLCILSLLQKIGCVERTGKLVNNIAKRGMLIPLQVLSLKLSGLKQRGLNYVFAVSTIQFI